MRRKVRISVYSMLSIYRTDPTKGTNDKNSWISGLGFPRGLAILGSSPFSFVYFIMYMHPWGYGTLTALSPPTLASHPSYYKT